MAGSEGPVLPKPAAASGPPKRSRKCAEQSEKAKATPKAPPLQSVASPQKSSGSTGIHASSITGLVDPGPSPGQTPVLSPPKKKTREEEAGEVFDNRPTLVLGETVEDETLSPIRPDRLEFEATQSEVPPLPKMSAKEWMCSKLFQDLLEEVLVSPDFQGDFASLEGFEEWPAGIPQTALTWAWVWRTCNFDLPFPFLIGEDVLSSKNESLDFMSSSCQGLLLKARQLVEQCLVGKNQLQDLLATTERLQQAKLKALEEKGLSEEEFKKAKFGILTWADGQKNRFQAQQETRCKEFSQSSRIAVSETAGMLRYVMESHDSVIPRPPLDDDLNAFVEELEAEMDASMTEAPADSAQKDAPVAEASAERAPPEAPPAEVPPSTAAPPVPPPAAEAACSH